jgi:hypothetical protein
MQMRCIKSIIITGVDIEMREIVMKGVSRITINMEKDEYKKDKFVTFKNRDQEGNLKKSSKEHK